MRLHPSRLVPFVLAANFAVGAPRAQIEVSAADQSPTFNATHTSGTVVWTPCTFTFTANAATAALTFRSVQTASLHFACLDGVGAAQAVSAVPASWGRLKALSR